MSYVINYPPQPAARLSLAIELKALPFAARQLQRSWLLADRFFHKDEQDLSDLLEQVAVSIKHDRAFDETASELTRVGNRCGGFISLPSGTAKNPPIVVYMHGYGGNGVWNVAAIRAMLPRTLVLVPTLGMASATARNSQLVDWITSAIEEARNHVNVNNDATKHLVSLSQGSIAATSLLNNTDYHFDSYTAISGHPALPLSTKRKQMLRVRLISGERDMRCSVEDCQYVSSELKSKKFNVTQWTIKNADHFMVLASQRHIKKLLLGVVHRGL